MVQIDFLAQELTSKNQNISDLELELENLSIAIHAPTSSNIDCEDLSQTRHLQTVVSALEKQVNICISDKMLTYVVQRS